MPDLKPLTLVLGPVAGATLGLALHGSGLDSKICWTAAITLTTAVWWVFESMPIPAASLLPFAALPLAGVLTHQQAATALGNPVILLLMGAFMLSKAIEQSGIHERFALAMIRAVGGRGGARLVLAFAMTAAFISMWVSNTATVLMLTPMALALLGRSSDPALAVPVLLAIAYGASIGGMGTLIGTPPNVIFAGVYAAETGEQFGFLSWMKIGVPIVLVAIPLVALWLSRGLRGTSPLRTDRPGPWQPAERRVVTVFGLTVLAWITQTEPYGGWTRLLGVDPASDATVALCGVVAMFLVPDGRGGRLLDWQAAGSIPWGVLLLFAGGICLAVAFMASGLSTLIGEQMAGLATLHPFLLVLGICLVVTFLTEITSNTAVATLMMPVMAAAAFSTGLPPALLMIPAAISASCAFMLPVATAPNAIVYATGQVTLARMAGEGFMLNLLMAGIISAAVYILLGHP